MGLQVINLSRKYFSELRNGSNFGSNTADFTTYLTGTVGEKMRAELTFVVRWFAQSSSTDTFTVSGQDITRVTGNFLLDGFAVGDTVIGYTTGGGSKASPDVFAAATITYVDATTMTISGVTPSAGAYTTMYIYGTNALEGCVYESGLVGNTETTNFLSKIDGNSQKWTASGVYTAAPSQVTATAFGSVNSWVDGSVKVLHSSLADSNTIQTIVITHDFVLQPLYVDGELINLSTGIAPAVWPVKHVFRATFRGVLSNASDNKTVQVDTLNGSSSWFGITPNGATGTFTVSAPTYTGAAKISANGAVNVSFTVTSNGSVFSAGVPFTVGIAALRDTSDYINTTTTFTENFMFETLRTTAGAAAANGTIITGLTGTLSGQVLTVDFDVDYSTAQRAALSSSDSFLIWIVNDGTSTVNSAGSKMASIVDVDTYEKSGDVSGLIELNKDQFEFLPHYFVDGSNTGYSDFKGWIEDGYLMKCFLNLFLNSTYQRQIKEMIWRVGAYDGSDFFPLTSYSIPVQGAVLAPNSAGATVPQFNINGSRGYALKSGDQFNQVYLKNYSGSLVTETYELKVGFKIPWEDWVANPAVAAVFYNPNQANNGLNNNSYTKQTNGYSIVGVLDVTVDDGQGTDTVYRFISPDGAVATYDRDGNVVPKYYGSIALFDATGAVTTNGDILSGEDTRIVATFTKASTFTLIDAEGVIRLDIENGGEFTIAECSSIWDRAANAPLKPVSGETLCKVTVTSTQVKLECLIDHTKITTGATYRISARIWDEREAGNEISLEDGDYWRDERNNILREE